MTLKLQLPKRVTLKLLLQKRWSLMLQLPNLLLKRMTLNDAELLPQRMTLKLLPKCLK